MCESGPIRGSRVVIDSMRLSVEVSSTVQKKNNSSCHAKTFAKTKKPGQDHDGPLLRLTMARYGIPSLVGRYELECFT